MYIPIDRKIKYRNNLLLERPLPSVGYLTTQVGDLVQPFTKLGMTKVSYQKLLLGQELKLRRGKKEGAYFYTGEKIGAVSGTKIAAPFNGYLQKEGDQYILKQEERDYWLLAGVWGEVVGIVKDTSVLLSTQAIDLRMVISTFENFSGELLVFPNPGEGLIMEYLENLSKSLQGKVVYIGDFLSLKVLKRASELGVRGVLAGGTDVSTYSNAKKLGIYVGLFVGFGNVSVPSTTFDIIKNVSNRFVFIEKDAQLLRIPVPEKFDPKVVKSQERSVIKLAKKGLQVLVLQKPNFGRIGIVDKVSESSIFVKFPEKEGTVEVFIPNVLSL